MISRTFLEILTIFSLAIFITNCSLFDPIIDTEPIGPVSQTFGGSYDEVWKAVQKSLLKYPIQVNNIDQGIIATDKIKINSIWHSADRKNKYKNAYYNLQAKVTKGHIGKKESFLVSITKTISVEKDFFAGSETLASDGQEEKAILYRVLRELTLDRSIRKAFEQSTQPAGN